MFTRSKTAAPVAGAAAVLATARMAQASSSRGPFRDGIEASVWNGRSPWSSRYLPKGASKDPFKPDEFLKAPALFKFGPGLLVLVGVLLAMSFFFSADKRIDHGRRNTYEAALILSQTTADAIRESVTQLLARLHGMALAVESMRGNAHYEDLMREFFVNGLGMVGDGIHVVTLAKDNTVVGSSLGLPRGSSFKRWVNVEFLGPADRELTLLPTRTGIDDSRLIVPVVKRTQLPDNALYIVFLVDLQRFRGIAGESFGTGYGWLRIEDDSGRPMVEAVAEGAHEGLNPYARVWGLNEAMSTKLDFQSNRLITAASAQSRDGLTVMTGMRESVALEQFQPRVVATWRIAAVASLVVLAMVGLTGLALRRFGHKERYLRRLATVDILSGLPNRRSFHNLLAEQVEASDRTKTSFALFFVDLDDFKYVNDSLGHEAGDALLRHAGAGLERGAGPKARVCRLGGDEFTVLLPVESAEETLRAGERLLDALRAPVELAGIDVQPRASIGAAIYPLQAANASDLMRFADTAMYCAKEEGKDRCTVYSDEMALQELEKTSARRDLERAIAHDELFLDYQPKFHMADGSISGFEALVRWCHPRHGTLLPAQFIPLAEESGLILQLGNWVLERSVRQIKAWHKAGEGWQRVAVNVSTRQLRGTDFVERVSSTLRAHCVPGGCLQVEVTETSLANEDVQKVIRQLRDIGIAVAVDDFGTGYSSMSALQRFELDYLKIDRSFVNDLHSRAGEEICRAVVSLAKALNMRVIAEGVETVAQREALARLECDEVQGFLFSRPVCPERAIAMARSALAWGRLYPLRVA